MNDRLKIASAALQGMLAGPRRIGLHPEIIAVQMADALIAAAGGPAIVIPEADWKRMVELSTRYFPTCKCDGDCQDCREDAEIKAIIERTEKANG